MKEEVLFVLLNNYADWESAFLSAALNSGVMPDSKIKYTVKTVAPTLNEVYSLGGFRTVPEYSFSTITDYYDGLGFAGIPQIRNVLSLWCVML